MPTQEQEPLAVRRVGHGPPLVLVHGDFNDGPMAWRRQLASPGGRALLVPDRRGYGASPPLTERHSIAADAADILAVVDAAGIDAFDLAGHSYGGLVAIDTALRAPGRVRSLVLVEPPLLSLLPHDPDVIDLRERVAAVWQAAGAVDDDAIAEAFFAVVAGPADAERLRTSRGWPDLVRQARRAVQGVLPDAFPADSLDRLPPNLGVAVLSGGRSHPGLRAIARAIAHRRARTAFVHSPDQGHAAQFDTEAFTAALAAAGAAPVTG